MMKDLAAKAAIAFASIAGARCVDLLAKRPKLACRLFNDGEPESWSLVSVPPGVGVPGLIAHKCDARQTVQRIDMIDGAERKVYPIGLEWIEKERPRDGWRRHETHLDNLRPLKPLSPASFSSDPTCIQKQFLLLKWAARAFADLARNWPIDEEEVCPPTPENLLGPDILEVAHSSLPHWALLGYGVRQSDLGQKAFYRTAAGYLTYRSVPSASAHLWQIGTALADRLNLLRESERSASLGLNVQGEENERAWAIRTMLCYSLHRLQGYPASAADASVTPEERLPFSVRRILKRMEQFPGPDSPFFTQLACLLAMFSEGRAFVERNKWHSVLSGVENLSGYASALLVRLTTCQFFADEELAEYLPPPGGGAPPPVVRRPALAWYLLGKRLEGLSASDPCANEDPSLAALVVGTRVLAVTSIVRSQVLELWALMDGKAQNGLDRNLPNPAVLGVEAAPFVHWRQQDAKSPVRYLVQRFQEATMARASAAPTLLNEITPLGWLVLLVGLVPAEIVSDFPTLREKGLADFAKALSVPATKNQERPWHDLEGIYGGDTTAWTPERTDEMLRVLGKVDKALGLSVRSAEEDLFSLRTGPGHTIEVTASDGTRRTMSKWQENDLLLLNDRPQGEVEYEPTRIDGYVRKRYRWSETWYGSRLVSIGVISPSAARLVGLMAITIYTDPSDPASSRSIAATETGPANIQLSPEESREKALDAPTGDSQQISRDFLVQAPIRELEKAQILSWSKRGKPNPRYARVALLQWEVDECYRHPLFDACLQTDAPDYSEVLRGRDKEPWEWKRHEERVRSCAEHRRQKILEAALRACGAFEVDILLLPEYSIRPDTIQHLLNVLPNLAPKTSVWAGTYRLPPGMTQSIIREYRGEISPWSAVLTAIPMPVSQNSGEGRLLWRAKKYPSVAADEVFRPRELSLAIEPLFQRRADRFDSRLYATELICSEVFLVTSPANLLPLCRAYGELMNRFTGSFIDPGPSADLQNPVIHDFWQFARDTDLQTGELNRRSIILVPAMTSRTTDYAVLGQAGYLAAGLTMVFCNAVLPPRLGIGQSCFIGHDSWDRDEHHPAAGMPTWDPYHGLTPGLFRPWQTDRGWLGGKEQAMVIADINPDATADAKPRPQFQAQPLRLVAHLPIIESWEQGKDAQDPSVTPRCRCMKVRHTRDFEEVADKLFRALMGRHDNYRAFVNTMDDLDPGVLGSALKSLADAAKHSEWLARRQEVYEREHSNNPQAWPPPVALDWLWVDLGETKASAYPEIEIPEYRASGGRDRLDQEHM